MEAAEAQAPAVVSILRAINAVDQLPVFIQVTLLTHTITSTGAVHMLACFSARLPRRRVCFDHRRLRHRRFAAAAPAG